MFPTPTDSSPHSESNTLDYYRERGGVIFLSYCRFWDRHAFVQQALAKKLVDAGIPVTWFDGVGWRPYSPTLYWNSPLLDVRQLPAMPGRRFSEGITTLSLDLQWRTVEKKIREHGGNPVIWVQGGIEEGLAERLPYIDIFSTFDDPYRHQPHGALCQKASQILCQNSFTLERLKSFLPDKVHLFLPPLELGEHVYRDTRSRFRLPREFPEKIMGYIGSFGSLGFDLPLFERFVRELPDWGFILMGRTDREGQESLNRLRSFGNFYYQPWAPRDATRDAWRQLDVSLLLYRRLASQDGAFPTKVSESLYFGTPCVATSIPKTADLEGFCPESQPEALVEAAIRSASTPPEKLRKAFQYFAEKSDPLRYLQRASEILQSTKSQNQNNG